MRLAESLCIRRPRAFRLRTMSVTSSRTPAIDENSCRTPSIWIVVIAAPWSDDSSTRRRALPSVMPKPRSSGSTTIVASRSGRRPGCTSRRCGLIRSCQFFWIMELLTIASDDGTKLSDTKTNEARGCRRTRGLAPNGLGRRAIPALDAAPLARAAAIVRDRRHVPDRGDREADRLQRAQSRLAARNRGPAPAPRALHAVLGGLLPACSAGDLRRERGALARALETLRARARPGDHVALRVGNRDHRVVERGIHMRDAGRDVLALAFLRRCEVSLAITSSSPSSSRRSPGPDPCASARWCGFAGHARAGPCDDADHGSSPDP